MKIITTVCLPKCKVCSKQLSRKDARYCIPHRPIKNKSANNGMWKGENAKLKAIHIWVIARKPKPEFCEVCKTSKPYDLANISQKYKRDAEDFEWLCRKCHMTKDGRFNNLKQYAQT